MIKNILPLILFLLFYFLFSIFTYKSYGNTWDEWYVYEQGAHFYRAIIVGSGPDAKLAKNELTSTKTYGLSSVLYDHLYEGVLYSIVREIDYEKFHLLNLLLAVFVYGSAYVLILRQYEKPGIAFLGSVFIFLAFRFSADIANNPKDGPFAVFYFVSLSLIFLVRHKNLILKIFFLGLFFGLAVSVRLLGFNLLLILFAFDANELFGRGVRLTVKNGLFFLGKELILQSGIITVIFTILFFTWPYLQIDTFKHLSEVAGGIAKFPFNNVVLYNGNFLRASQLPPSYLFRWLLISTPVFLLFFSAVSFLTVKHCLKNALFVLLQLSFWVNIVVFVVVKPVIYDGIRHYSFLLPTISCLAVISVWELIRGHKNIKLFYSVVIFLGINIFLVILQMVSLFPYQNLYFNELTGGIKGAYQRYETDYWGESYRESILFIKKNIAVNKQKKYKIFLCGNETAVSYFSDNMIQAKKYVDADYVVCFTRYNLPAFIPNKKVLYTVTRQGVPLSFVFKMR